MANVICVGDSITRHGFCPETHACPCVRGWVTRIRDDWEGAAPDFINAGVGGDTVVDLDHRVADEVVARRPDLVVVMVGLNDTWRFARDPARIPAGSPDWVEPPEFRRRYRRVLAACRAVAPVLVSTSTLLGEDPQTEGDLLNQRLAQVTAEVIAAAGEAGATLVDARAVFLAARKRGPRLTLADGVHLSDAGQELLARTLAPALRAALGT